MLTVSFSIFHSHPLRVLTTFVRATTAPAPVVVSANKRVRYAIVWSVRNIPEPREYLSSPVRWISDDKGGVVLEITEPTRLYIYADGDAKIFDLIPERNTIEVLRV